MSVEEGTIVTKGLPVLPIGNNFNLPQRQIDLFVTWKIPVAQTVDRLPTVRSPVFRDKYDREWLLKFYSGGATHVDEYSRKLKVELCLTTQGTKSLDETEVWIKYASRTEQEAAPACAASAAAIFGPSTNFPCTRLDNTFSTFVDWNWETNYYDSWNHKVTIFGGVTYERSRDSVRMCIQSPIYLDKGYADVTVCVEGISIPAHKVILAARSPVFYAMFNTEVGVDAKENRLVIKDFPVKLVEGMLNFIYNDQCTLRLEFGTDWLRIADMYGLDRLKFEAGKILGENLTLENAVEFFDAALLYNATSLKDMTVEFIQKNSEAIAATESMEDFAKSNPAGMIKLFAATHGVKRKE